MTCKQYWNDYVLSEICNGKGQYGIAKSGESYGDGKQRYLRITDITDDGFLQTGGKAYIEVDNLEYDKYVLNENDIVFARTGASAGRSYLYDKDEEPLIVAGFLIRYNLNNTMVNPRYMRYYTISNQYKAWVNGISTGSTRPNINEKMFSDMPISLPKISIQNQIVEILDSLENKVKNNNAIISNLEEQAQAIFKSWFIDFEPFQDGEFVDSELGEIPEGWKISKLSNEFIIEYGKNLPTKFLHDSGYPVFGANGIIGFYEEFIYERPKIILGCRGSVGEVRLSTAKAFITNNSLVFNEKDSDYFNYFYFFMKNLEFKQYATGSVQAQITIKNIKDIPIYIPSKKDINLFNKITIAISNHKNNLYRQNQILAQLRDTLLPKLMSGELRIDPDDVDDIEAQF